MSGGQEGRPRRAVVYLRTGLDGQQTLSLEDQQSHIADFKERHGIEELSRYEDLGTLADDGLGHAIERARVDGAFVLMDHLDDLARVIAVLNAAGINFISAQSPEQALYSFFHP